MVETYYIVVKIVRHKKYGFKRLQLPPGPCHVLCCALLFKFIYKPLLAFLWLEFDPEHFQLQIIFGCGEMRNIRMMCVFLIISYLHGKF